MINTDFVKAFVPEWNTVFNFKAKSIKRLYPNISIKHKLANEWLNEDDLILLEKDLDETQFCNYSDDWQNNYNNHIHESEKYEKKCLSKIKEKIGLFIENPFHPITKELYEVFSNSCVLVDPGVYIDSCFTEEIGNFIKITCNPHALILTKEMDVDILYFNHRVNLSYKYKNKYGQIEFMKFPIDHMLHNEISIITLETGITAYVLEKKGYNIGKLMVLQDKKALELPYKKWEIDQMIKYYHTMKDIDYSKRFSR